MALDLAIEADAPTPAATTPDTNPPLLSLRGEAAVLVGMYEPYVEMGAVAMDDRDGAVAVEVLGRVNTSVVSPGGAATVLTYVTRDRAGNMAQAQRLVIVYDECTKDGEKRCPTTLACSVFGSCNPGLSARAPAASRRVLPDTSPPTITLLGTGQLYTTASGSSGMIHVLFVGQPFIDDGATASDVVDTFAGQPPQVLGLPAASIMVSITAPSGAPADEVRTDEPTGPPDAGGVPYLVAYDVVDAAGNRARTVRRRVYVVCQPPELECPRDGPDEPRSCSTSSICGVAQLRPSSQATAQQDSAIATRATTASSGGAAASSSGASGVADDQLVPRLALEGEPVVRVRTGRPYDKCKGAGGGCDLGATATLQQQGDLSSKVRACAERATATGIAAPRPYDLVGLSYCGLDTRQPGVYLITYTLAWPSIGELTESRLVVVEEECAGGERLCDNGRCSEDGGTCASELGLDSAPTSGGGGASAATLGSTATTTSGTRSTAAFSASSNTPPRLALAMSGVLGLRVSVKRGTPYLRCLSGQVPTQDRPCEPGASAEDDEDGDLSGMVLLCPPADCAATRCRALPPRQPYDCGVDTAAGAVGSTYVLALTVFDSRGVNATAERIITIVTPCASDEYDCSSGGATVCSKADCATRALLLASVSAASTSSGPPRLFLLPSQYWGRNLSDAETNQTMRLVYRTPAPISLAPCGTYSASSNMPACAAVANSSADGDLTPAITTAVEPLCPASRPPGSCGSCSVAQLTTGTCLPGRYRIVYMVEDAAGVATALQLVVSVEELRTTELDLTFYPAGLGAPWTDRTAVEEQASIMNANATALSSTLAPVLMALGLPASGVWGIELHVPVAVVAVEAPGNRTGSGGTATADMQYAIQLRAALTTGTAEFVELPTALQSMSMSTDDNISHHRRRLLSSAVPLSGLRHSTSDHRGTMLADDVVGVIGSGLAASLQELQSMDALLGQAAGQLLQVPYYSQPEMYDAISVVPVWHLSQGTAAQQRRLLTAASSGFGCSGAPSPATPPNDTAAAAVGLVSGGAVSSSCSTPTISDTDYLLGMLAGAVSQLDRVAEDMATQETAMIAMVAAVGGKFDARDEVYQSRIADWATASSSSFASMEAKAQELLYLLDRTAAVQEPNSMALQGLLGLLQTVLAEAAEATSNAAITAAAVLEGLGVSSSSLDDEVLLAACVYSRGKGAVFSFITDHHTAGSIPAAGAQSDTSASGDDGRVSYVHSPPPKDGSSRRRRLQHLGSSSGQLVSDGMPVRRGILAGQPVEQDASSLNNNGVPHGINFFKGYLLTGQGHDYSLSDVRQGDRLRHISQKNRLLAGLLLHQVRRSPEDVRQQTGAGGPLCRLSNYRSLVTACGNSELGARIVGDELGGVGVDAVFNRRSRLFQPDLDPANYYNTTKGSPEVNPVGMPFGFFHEPLQDRPDGYPLLLDIRLSAKRTEQALTYLRDGVYLSATLTKYLEAELVSYNPDASVFGFWRTRFTWQENGDIQATMQLLGLPAISYGKALQHLQVSHGRILPDIALFMLAAAYILLAAWDIYQQLAAQQHLRAARKLRVQRSTRRTWLSSLKKNRVDSLPAMQQFSSPAAASSQPAASDSIDGGQPCDWGPIHATDSDISSDEDEDEDEVSIGRDPRTVKMYRPHMTGFWIAYEALICALLAAAIGIFYTYAVHLSTKEDFFTRFDVYDADSYTPARYFLLQRQNPGTLISNSTIGGSSVENSEGQWRLPADGSGLAAVGKMFARVEEMYTMFVLYTFLQGLVLALIVLRWLHYVSFQPRLSLIAGTLARALPDLLHLSMVVVVVAVMFAAAAAVTFGYRMSSLATWLDVVSFAMRFLMLADDDGVFQSLLNSSTTLSATELLLAGVMYVIGQLFLFTLFTFIVVMLLSPFFQLREALTGQPGVPQDLYRILSWRAQHHFHGAPKNKQILLLLGAWLANPRANRSLLHIVKKSMTDLHQLWRGTSFAPPLDSWVRRPQSKSTIIATGIGRSPSMLHLDSSRAPLDLAHIGMALRTMSSMRMLRFDHAGIAHQEMHHLHHPPAGASTRTGTTTGLLAHTDSGGGHTNRSPAAAQEQTMIGEETTGGAQCSSSARQRSVDYTSAGRRWAPVSVVERSSPSAGSLGVRPPLALLLAGTLVSAENGAVAASCRTRRAVSWHQQRRWTDDPPTLQQSHAAGNQASSDIADSVEAGHGGGSVPWWDRGAAPADVSAASQVAAEVVAVSERMAAAATARIQEADALATAVLQNLAARYTKTRPSGVQRSASSYSAVPGGLRQPKFGSASPFILTGSRPDMTPKPVIRATMNTTEVPGSDDGGRVDNLAEHLLGEIPSAPAAYNSVQAWDRSRHGQSHSATGNFATEQLAASALAAVGATPVVLFRAAGVLPSDEYGGCEMPSPVASPRTGARLSAGTSGDGAAGNAGGAGPVAEGVDATSSSNSTAGSGRGVDDDPRETAATTAGDGVGPYHRPQNAHQLRFQPLELEHEPQMPIPITSQQARMVWMMIRQMEAWLMQLHGCIEHLQAWSGVITVMLSYNSNGLLCLTAAGKESLKHASVELAAVLAAQEGIACLAAAAGRRPSRRFLPSAVLEPIEPSGSGCLGPLDHSSPKATSRPHLPGAVSAALGGGAAGSTRVQPMPVDIGPQ